MPRLPLRIALTFALTGTIGLSNALNSYARTNSSIQPNSPICQGLSEYESTGKIDRVIAALDKAIASDNKFIDAYLYRGALVGLVKEDFKAAIADFDRILAIDPNHVRANAYRGFAKVKNKDVRGVSDLDRAIELEVTGFKPFLLRAKLKAEKLKDIKGARQDFDRLIKDAPNAENYTERANFQQKYQKSKAGAIADYRQALKLHREQKNQAGIDRTLSQLRNLGVKG